MNSPLMGQPNGICRQNISSTKYQFDKISIQQNISLTKYQFNKNISSTKISVQQNITSTKYHFHKISVQQNISSTKYHFHKISVLQATSLTMCRFVNLQVWQIVHSAICLLWSTLNGTEPFPLHLTSARRDQPVSVLFASVLGPERACKVRARVMLGLYTAGSGFRGPGLAWWGGSRSGLRA
jgi:hypothetical protein